MRKEIDMKSSLLRQLYEKYYNEIYLYLFSLSRNKEVAQDLTQETFLKAILSLSDDHINMRAWLYMVARNLYYNYSKKANKHMAIDELEEIISDDISSYVLDTLISDEKKKLLYQALQHLDETKREILVMQYFGELSVKAIAALLKVTPENIRVLAYRAKKELKKYMEANGYDIL